MNQSISDGLLGYFLIRVAEVPCFLLIWHLTYYLYCKCSHSRVSTFFPDFPFICRPKFATVILFPGYFPGLCPYINLYWILIFLTQTSHVEFIVLTGIGHLRPLLVTCLSLCSNPHTGWSPCQFPGHSQGTCCRDWSSLPSLSLYFPDGFPPFCFL